MGPKSCEVALETQAGRVFAVLGEQRLREQRERHGDHQCRHQQPRRLRHGPRLDRERPREDHARDEAR